MLSFNFENEQDFYNKFMNGFIQDGIYEYLEEIYDDSVLNEYEIFEFFEADIGHVFISSNDLINKTSKCASKLNEIILSVRDRFIFESEQNIQKNVKAERYLNINTMSCIRMFNLIKDMDYELDSDDNFKVECPNDMFESFINEIFSDFNEEIDILLTKNSIKILNFQKVLERKNLNSKEFHEELKWHNSK